MEKVAIVTAASRGIGAACVRELAAQGYKLGLLSRTEDVTTMAHELGGVAVTGSVADDASIEALVAKTMETYGRIDAVVNNTGHPAKGELLEIPDEHWHIGLDLLVLNVIRIARHVTPTFEEQGTGTIVNISTYGAVEPDLAFPVSSALRAALSGFVKLYADKYASKNIRINNLLPGFIDSCDVNDDIRQTIPMARAGSVAEVGKVAAFLLSDEASYITGQNIRVDGGLTRSL